MLLKIIKRFSTKKSNFFWTEINPCVKEAEYAVRGVVPTLAVNIQNELKKGNKSIVFIIKAFLSMKLPFVTSAILKSFIKNPLPSSDKSYHVL
jgi:DUF1365 family protein